jgi:hypothetical protein
LTKKTFRAGKMPLRIFKHEQANLCAEDQACVPYRCKKDARAQTKNTTTRKIKIMNIIDTLQELHSDLETYYRDGARYVSRIVCNERM